jgi:GR25 family glycosyltransferase involved in LPS biosynthesis
MLVSTTSAFMRRKLASSASHARAWGALRDGMPTLILEDDAVFAGDALQRAATVIAEADRLHPRWHLIQLYSNCRIDAPLGAGVVPFGRSVDAHHGTVGYIISPQGAVTLSALLKQCWRNLSSTDLRKLQHEPHFALDLILMQWARTGAISVLWSTDRMVETIGQVGPLHREGDLLSTIFSRP